VTEKTRLTHTGRKQREAKKYKDIDGREKETNTKRDIEANRKRV